MTNTIDPKSNAIRDNGKAHDVDAPAGCCGGQATSDASACCARDEEVKASGGAGCGCASSTAAPKKGCC